MTASILSILASIAGLVSAYFLQKIIVKWLQAYRSQRQKSEQDQLKKQSEELARKSQEESDKLKEIEGR